MPVVRQVLQIFHIHACPSRKCCPTWDSSTRSPPAEPQRSMSRPSSGNPHGLSITYILLTVSNFNFDLFFYFSVSTISCFIKKTWRQMMDRSTHQTMDTFLDSTRIRLHLPSSTEPFYWQRRMHFYQTRKWATTHIHTNIHVQEKVCSPDNK